MKQKEVFSWNSLAFYVIQWMLAIWHLIPLPFLNPACTSGSSWFTYCWSLAWRILSNTLLTCEMSTIVQDCKQSLAFPSLGLRTSLVAQTVKCLSTMWETWVRSLGWEDPLERKWQSPPVPLPGKSHGQKTLVGYSPWGCKESDTTERLHFHFSLGLEWKLTFSIAVTIAEFSKFADILNAAL